MLIKKILVFGYLILMADILLAQYGSIRDHISVDTVLNFKQESYTINRMTITTAVWDNLFAFTCFNANKESDTAVVYIVHTDSYQTDTIKLFKRNQRKSMQKHQYFNYDVMALNNDRLLLAYGKTILVWRKIDLGYQFEKTIKYRNDYESFCFINDSLLLFKHDYYSSSQSMNLTVYNINKEKIVNSITPPYDNTLLSFVSIGRNGGLFDCLDNQILLANSNNYSFWLYDLNLNVTANPHCTEIAWHGLPQEHIQRMEQVDKALPANIIDILLEVYSDMDVMIDASFLDKEHILIQRKPSTESGVRSALLDVWENQHDVGWKRVVADIQDDGWTSHKDSIMNRNNIPLNCMGNIIRVVGNRIVSLTKEGCVENPVGMEVTDYFKERNQFLYENNPFIQVFIFSHDFLKR